MSAKHDYITDQIIDCAMRVHAKLGNGFQEVIYHRSLEIEMALEGIVFEREKEMTIYYREVAVGSGNVDFFVENVTMVEIKATIELEDDQLLQATNHLRAYHIEAGLLLNFGSKSLTFGKLVNKKFRHE
ncbi:MAG TPA: GxxExxY protein [Mucilaginibacter sp.]|jgi:GxxExxY protein